MTNAIDRGFDLLALLRVEENSIPFALKVKGMWGQISVPVGTEMASVAGMGVLGRRGRFLTLDFSV